MQVVNLRTDFTYNISRTPSLFVCVVVNFTQVIFLFLLFLLMYANGIETKEK